MRLGVENAERAKCSSVLTILFELSWQRRTARPEVLSMAETETGAPKSWMGSTEREARKTRLMGTLTDRGPVGAALGCFSNLEAVNNALSGWLLRLGTLNPPQLAFPQMLFI